MKWFWLAAFAGLALGLAHGFSYGADGLVQMLEARFVMRPGQTKVLPECGCTIRYLGTSVNGRHYVVRIDRLD